MEDLLLEIREHIAILTLNRTQEMNAIGDENGSRVK